MNTIKFSSIYELKKETNNVEVYDIRKIKIDGKEYMYYSNAQMSLYVTKKCNGNCCFCMNKFEKRCCKAKELNDDRYFKALEMVLDSLKQIDNYITITGGEPAKSNRLVKILRLIKEKGFKTRTFATNGTGLFDLYEDKPIIQHMLENNVINNINVSRMVIDEDKNKELMRLDQNNDLIRKIFNFGKINNMDMRLSCNLHKDGVKTLEDILEYNDYYDKLGIDTIMFRELIPLKNASKAYQESIIKMDNILNEIDNDSRFKYIKTLEGMYYIVKVYRYKDKIVKCYKEKKDLGIKIDDSIIREFVFYPDGNLDGGWDKEDGIILKEKSDLNERI